MKKIVILCGMLFLLLIASGMVWGQVGGNYDLSWSMLGGGGDSSGGTFVFNGVIGQPSAGTLTGGSFDLEGGFLLPKSVVPTSINYLSQVSTGQSSNQGFWLGFALILCLATVWHLHRYGYLAQRR